MGSPPPYGFEVELREKISEDLRGDLKSLPEFEITGPRTVATQAKDINVAFRRMPTSASEIGRGCCDTRSPSIHNERCVKSVVEPAGLLQSRR